MPTATTDPIIRSASTDPLASIDTGLSFSGSTINVYFGPNGFRAPSDQSISPGSETVPVSEGFNAYERQQFGRAFEIIEQYVDLRFEVVGAASDADFLLLLDTNQFTGSTLGYFYLPAGAEQYGVFDGTEWDRVPGGDLEVGGLGFVTIVHELLHGLGLDHPHDDGLSDQMSGVTKSFDSYGVANLNQGLYTTMSYNDGYQLGPVGAKPPSGADYGNQAGPMALDIAVLQSRYGANSGTNAGDTIYTLDRTNDIGTHWLAIWDVGGTDTIRSEGRRDVVIDLRPATLAYEQGGGGFVSAAANIAGGFTIASGVTIEHAIGGSGDDVLRGNGADNDLTGGAGDDTLTGGGGINRALYDSDSVDLLVAEIAGGWRIASDRDGTDDLFDIDLIAARDGVFTLAELLGGVEEEPPAPPPAPEPESVDTATGTAAAETLSGFAGNDTIDGAGGNDTIDGGIGFDHLSGGDGDDRLIGANGFDRLYGNAGADTLEGGFGNDSLFGGDGDDVLNGGLGFDSMDGGDGNDRIDALDGYDTLTGGIGNDLLNGNAGDDQLYGAAGDDRLSGGIGADLLSGGAGLDTLSGGNGADTLDGGSGADAVFGNAGADRIDGGGGADKLSGGIGADTFVFGIGSGQDTIMDLGLVDRVALDADLLDTGATIATYRTTVDGSLAFDFGDGDLLVLFGYDNVGQVTGLVELI